MATERPGGTSGPGDDTTRMDPLSSDRLLRGCTRIDWEGLPRPVLGRIVLTAAVGRGGMGAVYRGIHRTLGQERAVKVLLASADDAARERFLREARYAAQIDSPHLVRVHDADEDGPSGLVFLEMEFVRGCSAAQWVRDARGGVPEDEALLVCLAAVRGLEAAHAAGVVHRDLKPGNILLPAGPDGRLHLGAAKVADLGLARREEGDGTLTATNMFVGTPGYAPPEQIADAKRAGKPADVFSMGATLYALLSGRSPFEGSSTSDTIVRTTLGKRTPLADLCGGLSEGTLAIVDRCLSMDPADRYPDATTLREAIERRIRGAEQPTTAGTATVRGASEERTVAGPVPTPAPRRTPPPPPKPAPPTAAYPAPTSGPAPSDAPPGKSAARWIVVGGVVAVVVAVALWFADRDGSTPDAPAPESPPDPAAPDAPAVPGETPPTPPFRVAMGVARLDCPPGARVYLGDREIHEGERVPLGAGMARVELDGHAEQTVAYVPNVKGEVWIRAERPAPLQGRIVIAKLPEGVQAFRDGAPVAGALVVDADQDVTIEFRLRGFEPHLVTDRAAAGGITTVAPYDTWTWTGEMPVVLAPATKLRFELSTTFEGETAAALDASTGAAPAPSGIEWDVECVASSPEETRVRLRVTRVRGRVLVSEDGPFAFDSADAKWPALLAGHEDEIADVAPLGLLRAGAIDVTFGADGRPRTWKPFPTEVAGLVGVAEGNAEEVQRSVIGLLVLRPDASGSPALGSFEFQEATGSSARLVALHEEEGAEARSTLAVSLRDGFGTSLDIEAKALGLTAKVAARRK